MDLLSKSEWTALCTNAQAIGDCDKAYYDILKLYNEEDRYYHTQKHIAHCLREFKEISNKTSNAVAIEFAIWLHDVIYNPKNSDNEEQSVIFTEKCLSDLKIDSNVIDYVQYLILETRHNSLAENPDAAILVDIDLAILGVDESKFEEYERQIRQEYSWVPIDIYSEKRIEILKGFIERAYLYQTNHYRHKYEAQARKNIQRSIDSLTGSAEYVR